MTSLDNCNNKKKINKRVLKKYKKKKKTACSSDFKALRIQFAVKKKCMYLVSIKFSYSYKNDSILVVALTGPQGLLIN